MYVIRCKSKAGITRYVANAPVGKDRVWFKAELKDAHEFEEMGHCKRVRDAALEDNDGCDIMVKQL